METRQGCNIKDYVNYGTERLREEFLIDGLFQEDEIKLVYSMIDRIITGGTKATTKGVKLVAGEELRCQYFLERREMGVINIGGDGYVMADGVRYDMTKRDCLYLGRGVKEVAFYGNSDENPALFYLNCVPAHKAYPTRLVTQADAMHVDLGTKSECNERTIYKYILPGRAESCQLVMGLTMLKDGSNWNTMPTHTHDRRMEVYLYFDMQENDLVFHFMGDPKDTRHIVMRNQQAVISPSFSIHSGVGTRNYTFIWGMCGENQDFDDMDPVKPQDLR